LAHVTLLDLQLEGWFSDSRPLRVLKTLGLSWR
jgi:hypothetical protein